MTGVNEIAPAEDRLYQGLPVEFAAAPPGLHHADQSLVSLPGGHRRRFLFRPVLNLVACVAVVDRNLGSLAHRLAIRYHLQMCAIV